MDKGMDMEFFCGIMEAFIVENLRIIRLMGKVFIFCCLFENIYIYIYALFYIYIYIYRILLVD
jgi:hypothetical protein